MSLQVRLLVAESFEAAPIEPELRTPGANVFHYLNDQLRVDEARSIIDRLARRPLGAREQAVVVFARQATHEAQNALLKCFEEPYENTSLVLIVPHESLLLPTLRSRFTTVERGAGASETALAAAFMSASYKERLDEIASRTKAKDSAWVRTLVETLSTYMHDSLSIEKAPHTYRALALCANAVGRRGMSDKMFLEHLALALPVGGRR